MAMSLARPYQGDERIYEIRLVRFPALFSGNESAERRRSGASELYNSETLATGRFHNFGETSELPERRRPNFNPTNDSRGGESFSVGFVQAFVAPGHPIHQRFAARAKPRFG